jgi:hypothetical protein
MQSVEAWVKANAYTPDCCPDPKSEDMLDHAEQIEEVKHLLGETIDHCAFDVISGAGYEPRTTPIDTLMDAPMGLGLCVAKDMEHC